MLLWYWWCYYPNYEPYCVPFTGAMILHEYRMLLSWAICAFLSTQADRKKMFKTEDDMRTPFSDLNFATVQQEASWYLTRDSTDGSNLLFFVASARFLSALRQGFFEPTCYMAAGLAYAYYHLRCWRHEFCLEHNKAKWFNSNELAMQ